MACLRCQREVPADALFCPACGARQPSNNSASWNSRRLVRIPSEQKIAGVCAGLADYLDVDVTLVRALWLALTIVPGAIVGGVLAYALAWIIMPEGQPVLATVKHRLTRSVTNAKVAGVCGGIAEYFGWNANVVRLLFVLSCLLPGPQFVVYLVLWLIIPKK